MKKILLSVLTLFFVGCNSSSTQQHTNLDGKKLLEQKCSKCHNLDLPPKTSEDEKAPPMMAVAFHVKDFMQVSNESERLPKAKEFVKDYVFNPSASKSLCDKKSLKRYGVMPSQKGNLTQEELAAIVEYIFEHFNVKNLNEAQAIQNRLRKMAPAKRLAIKYGCLSCHKGQKDLVGPAFVKISQKSSLEDIQKSITNGSSRKWGTKAIMPSFKTRIPQQDIATLAKWIKDANSF